MWRNFPTASPRPIRSREGRLRPEGARLQRRPAGDAASEVSLDPFGLIRPLPGLPTKGSGAAFAVISPRVFAVSPSPVFLPHLRPPGSSSAPRPLRISVALSFFSLFLSAV